MNYVIELKREDKVKLKGANLFGEVSQLSRFDRGTGTLYYVLWRVGSGKYCEVFNQAEADLMLERHIEGGDAQ